MCSEEFYLVSFFDIVAQAFISDVILVLKILVRGQNASFRRDSENIDSL